MNAAQLHKDSIERERINGYVIHCERCGCVSSTVRRDRDAVARCAACYIGSVHKEATR
jgi:hypothetical protein